MFITYKLPGALHTYAEACNINVDNCTGETNVSSASLLHCGKMILALSICS